ncbi:MAG: NAD-dependent epimerase/dehydratase family protein [Bacteroidia bacterium]
MGKSVLITGGAGFVGSNLCIRFKKQHPDFEIFAFDNLKRRGSELNLLRLKESNINFIHGDIRNREDLSMFEDIDLIIDACADPSVLSGINSPVYPLMNVNLMGTVNCLELACKNNAAFIFLSTSRVYPYKTLDSCEFTETDTRYAWNNKQHIAGISAKGVTEIFPLAGSRSFYGAGKLASELIIEEYNEYRKLKTIINRCGIISGPWQMAKSDQGVLALWVARHYFKNSLNYIGYGGTGKQTRDVLHIEDLFDLLNYQVEHLGELNGQTFNAGGGNEVSFSLLELTQLCEGVTGNKIKISKIEEKRDADIRIYITDNSKINKATGWKPACNMEKIVSDTFHWLHENEKSLKQILID